MCEGTMHVESNFERLPLEDECWGHEWNFPLYYCARRLILPAEALPSLGKPETRGAVCLNKLHTLKHVRDFDAIDAGNMPPRLWEEVRKTHEPPPTRLKLRIGSLVALTADAGGHRTGDVLVLLRATDTVLTCRPTHTEAARPADDVELERMPYSIHVSTTHGNTSRTQTWTRMQFPVIAAPPSALHAPSSREE